MQARKAQIGGSRFCVFRTGRSKSRLNFLSLLRAGCEDHIINDGALDYMRHRKVAPDVISTWADTPVQQITIIGEQQKTLSALK